MASHIKDGESLFIPFRDGQSISDSQLKPRMYKTMQAFERSFPRHYLAKDGVELVEYAPVVRCKDCIHWYDKEETCLKIYSDGAVSQYAWQFRLPNDFCSYGERKDNG